MNFNVNKYRLSEIAEVITGFPFKGDKYGSEGIRVVRGENVTVGNLRWDTIKCWNEPFKEIEKYSLREGDIVIGMDGSKVGKNRAQIKKNDLPLILAQRVARLRAKQSFSQDFLAYIIKSVSFEQYVDAIKTGTSIPHISPQQIKDFEFIAPDHKLQEQIASILSSLDDRIDLNNRTNKTLEAIAQTLFKEMCVPKGDELPEGWRVSRLDEIGRVVTGKTPSSKNPEDYGNEMPFVTPSDFKNYTKLVISAERKLSYQGVNKLKNKILPANSVIVTCIGSDMGKVVINKVECITNQQINSVVLSETDFLNDFLYYTFLSKYDFLRSMASGGSTMPIINKSHFESINIIVPEHKILKRFSHIISGINCKIANILMQNQTLISIRGSLLPKLMKGEIEVN